MNNYCRLDNSVKCCKHEDNGPAILEGWSKKAKNRRRIECEKNDMLNSSIPAPCLFVKQKQLGSCSAVEKNTLLLSLIFLNKMFCL